MKKVLILTPFFPPFPRAGGLKRVMNFIHYLPGHDWEPHVMTMDWGPPPHGIKGRVHSTKNIARAGWNAYRASGMEPKKDWKAFILKMLISLARFAKRFLLLPDELILWLFWALPKGRSVIRTEKPDALFVYAPPFSSLLIGVLLKKLYRVPLVCDIRDDWVGNPANQKKFWPLAFIERNMERWVAKNADRVVLVTAQSLDAWSRRYPTQKEKFIHIPNGYNEEELSTVPPEEYQEFTMLHLGTLEKSRSPEPVIRAVARLKEQGIKIHFYQYGLSLQKFQHLPVKYNVSDLVHFEGTIGPEEAIAKLKGASLPVLLPSPEAPAAIPGKAYEYLRTDRPILLISDENATTKMAGRFSGVFHVPLKDVDTCVEVIRKIYSEQGKRYPERLQEGIVKFDRKYLTSHLAEVLDSLAKGSA